MDSTSSSLNKKYPNLVLVGFGGYEWHLNTPGSVRGSSYICVHMITCVDDFTHRAYFSMGHIYPFLDRNIPLLYIHLCTPFLLCKCER